MAEHDERELFLDWMDDETERFYSERAIKAGRTLEEQLCYELRVNHRLCLPDPGDEEATQRAVLLHRMWTGNIQRG